MRKLRLRVKGLGGKAKAKKEDKVQKKDEGKVKRTKDKAKSRLTDALIDRLQNYFGIALRSNVKTVPELKSALLANLVHVTSCKGNNFHTYCPQTSDSWCQYHRDYINKTNLYRPGPGIASDVIKEVKTVYRDLTKDADLAKCLHGIAQNANESLNAMFWERAPKSNYCGIDKLQLSVYDSVAVFNYEGKQVWIF